MLEKQWQKNIQTHIIEDFCIVMWSFVGNISSKFGADSKEMKEIRDQGGKCDLIWLMKAQKSREKALWMFVRP